MVRFPNAQILQVYELSFYTVFYSSIVKLRQVFTITVITNTKNVYILT